jgi:hypothetical protein
MPFVTHVKDPDRIPTNRKADWGVPSGRVRHIEVKGDHAIYVIEEEPSVVPVIMKADDGYISHDVWLPWRYYVIRAYSNCRVSGRQPGYMFFANKRIESLDDRGLLKRAVFPNVYDGGGICLGYTGHVWDRTPVRAAWRAIRLLYSKPGNQWFTGDYFPRSLMMGKLLPKECDRTHRYGCTYACYWSMASKEEVLEVAWFTAPYVSLSHFLSNVEWDFNSMNVLSESEFQKRLRETVR